MGKKHATITVSVFIALCLLLTHFPAGKVLAVSSSDIWNKVATEIALPTSEYKVTDVVETNAGLFIATDMEIYRSTDKGQTWTLKYNATSGIEASSLYATSKNWLVVVFLYSDGPPQHISKDGGETWVDCTPGITPWRTGIAELPNGTILEGRWGEGGGGCVYESEDGIDYDLAWNFTALFPDYPQNHTHSIGFNPYNGKTYVGVGDVMPKLLYVSSDYGLNWVRYTTDGPVGMWFEPDGTAYFGCDWGSDDIFKIMPPNDIVKLALVRKYGATPHVHHIIRENNVFYAGLSSEFDPSPIGVAVSSDGENWLNLKIIANRTLTSTTIVKGLTDDHLWIILDDRLYNVRALEQGEVEQLANPEATVLAVDGQSCVVSSAENIIGNPKVRVYGVNVTNLLINPSFESWKEGQPAGWSFLVYPYENWTTTLANVTGYAGNRAVRIEASTTVEEGFLCFNQSVPLVSGKSYTLSVYFKSNITRSLGPYAKISGKTFEQIILGKTVYDNWTRLVYTFDNIESTILNVEIGWNMYGITAPYSGILLDIDAVLLQEGIEVTPFVETGTFATQNPKMRIGDTWLNYTGVINGGSYQEFDLDRQYFVGSVRIAPEVGGSRVANVTILGAKTASVRNAIITESNGESFAGIYYGTPVISGTKVLTLVSSLDYGKIANHRLDDSRLVISLFASTGLATNVRIYIPSCVMNQTTSPNGDWTVNCTAQSWNETWDKTTRILTISTFLGTGSATIEVYGTLPANSSYPVWIYSAVIAIVVGCFALILFFLHKRNVMARALRKKQFDQKEASRATPREYVFSSRAIWYWTTIGISMATTIAAYLIPENAHPMVYVRNVLGAVFVLWLPGYALMKALFPTGSRTRKSSGGLDSIERIALSIGMSIAVVPMIALLLNYTPWGIRLLPLLLSLLATTVALSTVALVREYQT